MQGGGFLKYFKGIKFWGERIYFLRVSVVRHDCAMERRVVIVVASNTTRHVVVCLHYYSRIQGLPLLILPAVYEELPTL